MNNSGNDTPTFYDDAIAVQEINDNMVRLHAPATAFIAVLMIVGLIGNTMVVYFYVCKTSRTTCNICIAILAVYDIIVCAISMPNEIVDIELYYTFTNEVACKVLTFINYLASIGSVFTLMVIAVDRYKRICNPTGLQMDNRKLMFVSACVVAVSIVLSLPVLFLFGTFKIPIAGEHGRELYGTDCTISKEDRFAALVWVFNGVHLVLFVIFLLTLIVLYSIIGRIILAHRKVLRKHDSPIKVKMSMKKTDSSVKTSIGVISEGDSAINRTPPDNDDNGHVESQKDEMPYLNKYRRGSKMNQMGIQQIPKSTLTTTASLDRNTNAIRLDRESIRLTMVMIVVAAAFILSFLPYITLTIWRSVEGKHETEFLTGGDLVMFRIVSRSFLLNSALNPWIYGIFNSAFRNFFFGRFKNCS